MKKSATLVTLLIMWVLLTWCFRNKDKESIWIQEEEKDPCTQSWWIIENWEYWEICTFNDWSFCNLNSFLKWDCKKWDKYEEIKYTDNESLLNCPITFEPVCGEDWQTYANKCFLERQGINQAENAYVWEDWKCIYITLEEILNE